MNKRILHMIETSGPGGAENMMIRLITGLDSNRYESEVCLLKDGWLNQQFSNHGITSVVIPHNRSMDILWLHKLVKFLREKEFALIHSHEFAMNVYASILSVLTSIPCVTTVHGKNYYSEKLRRRLAYRFVSKNSYMIAVSENVSNFLLESVSIQEKDIHIIVNGIDVERYKADETSRNKIRESLGISEQDLLVGAIGNLYSVKGHIYFVEAAGLVCKLNPDVHFIIAGRGDMQDELQSRIRELGLEKNFSLLGFREDVPDLLQAMDIYVMSSLSEGMPLSILEAMSARKPVISTDVGGISEVISHDKTGILVPSKRPDALADAIFDLDKNPEKINFMVENAIKLVHDKFSLHSMISNYESVYEGLI